MGQVKASPTEYEVIDGKRTGRTRERQFTPQYAKTARTGLWPKDRNAVDAWMVPFAYSTPSPVAVIDSRGNYAKQTAGTG